MNTEQRLRSNFEIKLASSIRRAELTDILPIIPNHYFTKASSEIQEMFISGYFIGAITLSQSVAEGLSRFMCERNGLRSYPKKDHLKRVNKLLSINVITPECKIAFDRIHEGRDDFHHMNENIETDPTELEANAKLNVECLFLIEREIFDHSFRKGKIIRKHPQYWDDSTEGTTMAFLRSLP